MEEVRSGKRSWTILDVLHRESLDALLEQFGIKGLSEEQVDHLNRIWHRPWPDSVSGLTRLQKNYTLATLSNGNIALLVQHGKTCRIAVGRGFGRRGGTALQTAARKAYLSTARMLGLSPEQCMLVAAHNSDLVIATAHGFRTAFIYRPTEYGPDQSTDLEPSATFDWVARSMNDLADQLNC